MPTVYITAPRDDAHDLARSLVDERLAACVNLLECDSIYRWDDAVVTDEECILLAKTTDTGYDDLRAYVEEHHPYDVPCIERFDEAEVQSAFAEWVDASVSQ